MGIKSVSGKDAKHILDGLPRTLMKNNTFYDRDVSPKLLVDFRTVGTNKGNQLPASHGRMLWYLDYRSP